MDYTKRILHDLECNYLDLSKDNANNILKECINKPFQKKIKTENINSIEGFAADYSSGVRYIPDGKCPDGYTKNNDGCYQVCKSCNYSDKHINKNIYPEGLNDLLNDDTFNYVLTDTDWDLNQNGEFIE